VKLDPLQSALEALKRDTDLQKELASEVNGYSHLALILLLCFGSPLHASPMKGGISSSSLLSIQESKEAAVFERIECSVTTQNPLQNGVASSQEKQEIPERHSNS
jgi:hypothetical protein